MPAHYDIDPYEPCPCGSGKKYKFCCAAKGKQTSHGKYPLGTVAYYGPDDKTTTKIAACVFVSEGAEPVLRRWLGEANIEKDPKIGAEIKQFFASHGVKNVAVTDGVLGCPHEEGIDFPRGQECPFCPLWHGKQGIIVRGEGSEGDLLDEDDEWDEDEEMDEDEDDFDDEDQDAEEDGDDSDDQDDADDQFARVEAILGGKEMDMEQAVESLLAHLKANLQLPCEVTGSEDFNWEEPYVLGGWSPAEYRRLKKTQPSYRDRFELLSLDRGDFSEWMMFDEDIAARVRRKSDGKEFVLGLAELKVTDKKSPNYQLLDDYAVWFVNSR